MIVSIKSKANTGGSAMRATDSKVTRTSNGTPISRSAESVRVTHFRDSVFPLRRRREISKAMLSNRLLRRCAHARRGHHGVSRAYFSTFVGTASVPTYRAFAVVLWAGLLNPAPPGSTDTLGRDPAYVLFHYLGTVPRRDDVVMGINRALTHINVHSVVTDCVDDPDDNKFLALALDGDASILATGDQHLLKLHPWRHVHIMRTGDFVRAQAEAMNMNP